MQTKYYLKMISSKSDDFKHILLPSIQLINFSTQQLIYSLEVNINFILVQTASPYFKNK